jgi:hypothetical protein
MTLDLALAFILAVLPPALIAALPLFRREK